MWSESIVVLDFTLDRNPLRDTVGVNQFDCNPLRDTVEICGRVVDRNPSRSTVDYNCFLVRRVGQSKVGSYEADRLILPGSVLETYTCKMFLSRLEVVAKILKIATSLARSLAPSFGAAVDKMVSRTASVASERPTIGAWGIASAFPLVGLRTFAAR